MKCNNYTIYCQQEKRTCKGCYYERRKEKMYEVTFTMDGVMHKATLPGNDALSITQMLTNMYGNGKIQIINVIKKG